MENKSISIRPFIGAKDFELSRRFYKDLGFQEVVISAKMSLFKTQEVGFYLQDAYVRDWVDNTMVFVEVENVNHYYTHFEALKLTDKYKGVRLSPIKVEHWGRECFLHDPSGVLWHFGEFFDQKRK
ncbi:MAG: glyoxalase [Pedobacter sp.]|nr:MAG: glyoxalase [Pedobacter sp.]